MKYQIEITTRCNYSCSYCVGRQMKQQDMSWDLFVSIVDKFKPKSYVTLQGEGEPSVHPRFWDMVEYVANGGHSVNTTFNGTQLDTILIPKFFKTVNVSIDSLDSDLCNSIGRVNLPKVLSNLDDLLKVFESTKITIRTVDFGQNLEGLKKFTQDKKLRWKTQHLITKPDYASTYVSSFEKPIQLVKRRTNLCQFLRKDLERFFNIDGIELPCCMIKDASSIVSIEQMKIEMPVVCSGCKIE